jgi:predicted nucleic acid-binding protein
VFVPPAVHHEIVEKGFEKAGAREVEGASWIDVHIPQRTDITDLLSAQLDRGEAESIALAIEMQADWLLIDERLGRHIARNVGISVKGTLGLLMEAYRRGQLTDLRAAMDELRAKGTWIDDGLYVEILRMVKEQR